MWSLPLFAALLAAEAPKDLLERSEIVWALVGLTGSLLVGAAVIYGVDKWRKRSEAVTSDTDEAGTLSSYRAMHEAGEITDAEYAELKRRVADRVKKAPSPVQAPGAGPGGRPALPHAPAAPHQAPAPPTPAPDPPPPA